MIQFVQSNQVMQVNGIAYAWPNTPNGIPKTIACRSEVGSYYWMVPRVSGMYVVGYDTLNADSAVKPRPDAFKILRIKDAIDANTEYGIAVEDTDGVTTNAWAALCNGCCGDTPVMPTVTIPYPIIQQAPNNEPPFDGSNTFIFPFPPNPNALGYAIPYPWFNGTAPGTAFDTTGITTPAQFVTWANTNWGDYGTWTSTGNIVKLVSADTDTVFVVLAGLSVALVPASYCFDLTTFSGSPAPINNVQFGTGSSYPFAPMILTNTSQNDLINRLSKIDQSATFVSIANKLTMTTLLATPKLRQDTTNVSVSSAGACS